MQSRSRLISAAKAVRVVESTTGRKKNSYWDIGDHMMLDRVEHRCSQALMEIAVAQLLRAMFRGRNLVRDPAETSALSVPSRSIVSHEPDGKLRIPLYKVWGSGTYPHNMKPTAPAASELVSMHLALSRARTCEAKRIVVPSSA